MTASIRGEKRRKSRPQETCPLCGRTGTRGFITRNGLRVCWAVPRCMERTLSEPEPYRASSVNGSPRPWSLTSEAFRRILSGQLDFDSSTFRVRLYRDGEEIPTRGGYTRGGLSVQLVTVYGDSSVKVSFADSATWTATSLGFSANEAKIHDGYGVLCCAGIGDVTVACGTLTIARATPIFQLNF